MLNNFFPENRAVYEIMWKINVVNPDKSQMTIRRMLFACVISKARIKKVKQSHYRSGVAQRVPGS